MTFKLDSVVMAGKEITPLVEGGKGIAISNGTTSGKWANCGGAGTFSGVFADRYDKEGNVIPNNFKGRARKERQDELVKFAIEGGITQAKIAHEEAKGNGLVFMNVLWEMGACTPILEGILDGAKGLINGISCGAGMPYNLSNICADRGVYYNPIVSSARALKLLWKRSYHKTPEYLGAVIYEDPWLAGGHNGLSNAESPTEPQDPMPRIKEIRKLMNELGLQDKPIIIAGGVWWLSEWTDYLNNPEIGPVAFQFGTRPMVTQESPIKGEVKRKFFTLKKGGIHLQKFSPTGFYSSAANNPFMQTLSSALMRQLEFRAEENKEEGFTFPVTLYNGIIGKYIEKAIEAASHSALADKVSTDTVKEITKIVYIRPEDKDNYNSFVADGFDHLMKTPDQTLLFVTPERFKRIRTDMKDCVGCLSGCMFSGWSQRPGLVIPPDPRSFCIQKGLQEVAHTPNVNDALLFSGHTGYRFATDPFYEGGKHIPTIKELFEQIKKGY